MSILLYIEKKYLHLDNGVLRDFVLEEDQNRINLYCARGKEQMIFCFLLINAAV